MTISNHVVKRLEAGLLDLISLLTATLGKAAMGTVRSGYQNIGHVLEREGRRVIRAGGGTTHTERLKKKTVQMTKQERNPTRKRALSSNQVQEAAGQPLKKKARARESCSGSKPRPAVEVSVASSSVGDARGGHNRKTTRKESSDHKRSRTPDRRRSRTSSSRRHTSIERVRGRQSSDKKRELDRKIKERAVKLRSPREKEGKSEKACFRFLARYCKFGSDCRYRHTKERPLCSHFMRKGRCKFGDNCHYRHVIDIND